MVIVSEMSKSSLGPGHNSNLVESSSRDAFPDTGWRGEPLIPSSRGGSNEKDFMKKPPYDWTGEGDLFKPKYRKYVIPVFQLGILSCHRAHRFLT